MNKHPSALSLEKSFKNMWLWCSGCLLRWHMPGFKNPVAQQLSDDRKGHGVTVSCYPLCEALLRLLTRYTLCDKFTWSSWSEPLPDLWSNQITCQSPRILGGKSHWGETGKALKPSPCWLQQGFISPRAWPAPLTVCPVPKTLSSAHWKPEGNFWSSF